MEIQNKKQIIVGINDSHDASACVVINGKLVCAISEERCQRVKNTGGFPKNAIEKCLEIADVKKSEINHIVIGSKHVSCENLHNFLASLSISDHYNIEENYWQPIIYNEKTLQIRNVLNDYKPKGIQYYPLENFPLAFNRELNQEQIDAIAAMRLNYICNYFGKDKENVHFMDHHTCHAYYAYYSNPARTEHDEFLVFTADAGGDGAYETVSVFRNDLFKSLHKGRQNILAKIYSYTTLLLGMKPHEHEFKVMGLSPYAKEYHKKKPFQVFSNALQVEGLTFKRNPEVKDFFKYFKERLKDCRFDGIAGGLQDFAEQKMVEWVSNGITNTGINNIILSGGVALNIKANKKIIEIPNVNSLFIPPGVGDESLSVGACYVLIDRLNKEKDSASKVTIEPLNNGYLGNKSTPSEKEKLLNHPIIKEKYNVSHDASPEEVANILMNGEICALFIDNMEFGPRALGHRSLIADPSNPAVVEKINEAIKMRDFWMPFTPSILSERIDDYIVNPKNINCSYMTVSFDTTELGKKHLAGAIHPYDKTARPQRVEQEISPTYYSIIKAFEATTGIGAVLNTSLNIHGKPIVMEPVQIAEELLSNDQVEINYIYVDGTLLMKKK